MKPLYAAMYHACNAERHQEALNDVYWERILRKGESYSTRRQGLFGEDLIMLSGFFESLWDRPRAKLDSHWKARLLGLAGTRLRAQGRLREAVVATEASLRALLDLGNLAGAAREARHLSEHRLVFGELDAALASARQGIDLADRSGDAYERYTERAVLAAALHHSGQMMEAAEAFHHAEAILAEHCPELAILYSLWGFRWCDLLLDLDRHDEVFGRALRMRQTRESAEKDPEGGLGRIGAALEDLALARASLRLAQQTGSPSTALVKRNTDLAVKELRESGRQDLVPLGYLTRAAFRRWMGDWAGAEKDLREARVIATRGQMRLHEVDCFLEETRLRLAAGDTQQARTSLTRAALLMKKTHYGRRDREVRELRQALGLGCWGEER
jgi:hypothetical protein